MMAQNFKSKRNYHIYRDHSSAYCYLKCRKQDSQEYVDEWIPFERPSMPFHEAHPFRAKQVGGTNTTA